ncbi:MAG: bifunctional 3-hydroxydecanoyl-ACP dehydratase/trans-2-decenoyl-ACP isomerase [Elusimicrobiota bacterium]
MICEEFQKKSRFTREEIATYAQGRLVEGIGAAGLPRLPGFLILPFHEITRIEWDPGSGTGRIEALRHNKIDDWFYACHFLGDPVMPGCWGIDAVWQCLRFFAAWRGLTGCDKILGMANVSFSGQIRPYDKAVVYAVDMISVENSNDGTLVTGRASVMVDGTPVYAIGSAQIGTAYWESAAPRRADPGLAQTAPDVSLRGRITRDEFSSGSQFSHAEIVALSQGTLIDCASEEIGLLPSSLMLEVGRIERIEYDEFSGEGSIAASKENDPMEWFYPMNGGVKPAALSIDAAWQLMGIFLTWRGNAGTGRALGFERVEIFDAVKPEDRRICYEINILRVSGADAAGSIFVRADAKVWADGRLILVCANASVCCRKNIRYNDYPQINEKAFGGKLGMREAETEA